MLNAETAAIAVATKMVEIYPSLASPEVFEFSPGWEQFYQGRGYSAADKKQFLAQYARTYKELTQ